jgi:hypothetical protein
MFCVGTPLIVGWKSPARLIVPVIGTAEAANGIAEASNAPSASIVLVSNLISRSSDLSGSMLQTAGQKLMTR